MVAGSLAQRPGYGGHTWVFLQYLLGFRRLGYDVLFVDRLEEGMCAGDGPPAPLEESVNVRYLVAALREFGLEGSFGLLQNDGRRSIGLSREQLIKRTKQSTLLLNVMGYLDDDEILGNAPKRAFLDIDPGFGQMWRALGLHDLFTGHDDYVTIGENIGATDCTIPTCGIEWVTTRQPIVLDHWPEQPVGGSAFTSVASWRGPFAPLTYDGRTYGLRVHEFRKFFNLPGRTGCDFEAALDIDTAEVADIAALERYGWSLVDPREVAGTPSTYRRYIQSSKAELMVAKNMYVQSRSGWFSDRSICYLASGKPVLAQDTGLGRVYPEGEGLVTYSTLDEAIGGVEEICGNYPRHARAARGVAEEYFDSDKVLSELLTKLGVT